MNVYSIPDSLSCHTRKFLRPGMSKCSFCYWYRYLSDRCHLLSRSGWCRFAPKSPFFCFNKSPIRYGFWQQCRHKLNKCHKRNRSKWRNKEKDICILVVRVTIRVYEKKPHFFLKKISLNFWIFKCSHVPQKFACKDCKSLNLQQLREACIIIMIT